MWPVWHAHRVTPVRRKYDDDEAPQKETSSGAEALCTRDITLRYRRSIALIRCDSQTTNAAVSRVMLLCVGGSDDRSEDSYLYTSDLEKSIE